MGNRKKLEFNIVPKCAPEEKLLGMISGTGFSGVELYTDNSYLADFRNTARMCAKYDFRYAVHAPADNTPLRNIIGFIKELKPEVLVLHNIYWDDEWEVFYRESEKLHTKICVENVSSVLEPVRFMRRFGFRRCLDLEHLQMEATGVFREVFVDVIKQASHIHMTGYVFGTDMWHTPVHYSKAHAKYLLGLIKQAGYSGLVVSEASVKYQTQDEFKKLKEFSEEVINKL